MDKLEELALHVSPEAAPRCVLQEKESLEISQIYRKKNLLQSLF